jgi:hypothetical protein
MNAPDVAQPVPTEHLTNARKPYEKPTVKRVTPKAAKKLLLQKADLSDPEVTQMLQCIEGLLKGSE